MNKYKEALWSIDFTMHNRVKPKYLQNVEDKNFEILYELVEKAIPKIPIYGDFEEVDDNVYVPNTAKCPTCGNEFKFGEFNDIVNHHCVCGQALDWSEEDE